MARQIPLAYLTTPGFQPLKQIKIASEAGCGYVSLRTIPVGLPGRCHGRRRSAYGPGGPRLLPSGRG